MTTKFQIGQKVLIKNTANCNKYESSVGWDKDMEHCILQVGEIKDFYETTSSEVSYRVSFNDKNEWFLQSDIASIECVEDEGSNSAVEPKNPEFVKLRKCDFDFFLDILNSEQQKLLMHFKESAEL